MRNALKITALLVALMLVFGLPLLAGCSQKSESGTAKTGQSEPATEQGSGGTKVEEGTKTLAIGDKTSVGHVEIAIEKVTVTNDIVSPEANGLLLTGEPGEGQNVSKTPAADNEFLMVTFKLKNTGSEVIAAVAPLSVKLENAEGKEYTEVETSGYGGIFNAKPLEAGQETLVTAIYEVPSGETGLALTYEPFGEKPVKFNIR